MQNSDIKTISVNKDLFLPKSSKNRKQRGVIIKDHKSHTRKTNTIKKSEIMHKIRRELLDKKRKAISKLNSHPKDNKPSNKINLNPNKNTSIDNAIQFFESKRKEKLSKHSLGNILHDNEHIPNHNMATNLKIEQIDPLENHDHKLDVHLDIPTDLKHAKVTSNTPAKIISVHQNNPNHNEINTKIETPPVPNYKLDNQKFVSSLRPMHTEDNPNSSLLVNQEKIHTTSHKNDKTKSKFNRKKTYRVGKKGRRVGVMLYDRTTRKNLKDQHREFSAGDLSKIRRTLRHRFLVKTGSTAPPRLIREIYKNTRLFGDVMGKCDANDVPDYYPSKEQN